MEQQTGNITQTSSDNPSVIEGILYSFYNTSFYKKILNINFSYTFKVLLLYSSIITIVGSILFNFLYLPKIRNYTENFPDRISRVYPDDLTVTIKDGRASINKKSPVVIPIQDLLGNFTPVNSKHDEQKNLIIIDIEGDIKNFEKYNSFALLTEENLAVMDDQAGFKVISLKEANDVVIDQKFVKEFSNKFEPFVKSLPKLILVFGIVGFLLFNIIFLLFVSLITGLALLLIGELIHFGLPYTKHYQFAVHFGLVSQTLIYLIMIMPINLRIPYFPIIISLLLALIIYPKIKPE